MCAGPGRTLHTSGPCRAGAPVNQRGVKPRRMKKSCSGRFDDIVRLPFFRLNADVEERQPISRARFKTANLTGQPYFLWMGRHMTSRHTVRSELHARFVFRRPFGSCLIGGK